ncbi:hypothetical protein GCM10010377_11160 [Streptomyces viridiviolaceus]|uniref:Uncharacterized protein n=1 Tax=Streptomyces viridiviolaceus TaxID=68282 RepID=A0ABW2E8I5_9ACTN|nr:hypothetical protein [Streptomyces viridiviolaceus]GHB23038.1 hypothetical protein GCM10010377_11160 [Streptomyces viridiviolaceus]
MKSLKAAAVIAGSLIAAGAAAPAHAQETELASTGLDTGLRTALPFELWSQQEDTDSDGPLLHTTKDAAAALNEAKPVHGDLGLHA